MTSHLCNLCVPCRPQRQQFLPPLLTRRSLSSPHLRSNVPQHPTSESQTTHTIPGWQDRTYHTKKRSALHTAPDGRSLHKLACRRSRWQVPLCTSDRRARKQTSPKLCGQLPTRAEVCRHVVRTHMIINCPSTLNQALAYETQSAPRQHSHLHCCDEILSASYCIPDRDEENHDKEATKRAITHASSSSEKKKHPKNTCFIAFLGCGKEPPMMFQATQIRCSFWKVLPLKERRRIASCGPAPMPSIRRSTVKAMQDKDFSQTQTKCEREPDCWQRARPGEALQMGRTACLRRAGIAKRPWLQKSPLQ